MKFNYPLFLLFILLGFSCKKERNDAIDGRLVTSLFIDTTTVDSAKNYDSFNCEFVNDTIKQKQVYADALKQLLDKYTDIDKLHTTEETKQYAKSLLLAEWIYGSFYYQFLGPDLGMADTAKWGIDFTRSDITSCYNAGISGEIAVWCENRAVFFTRMIDTLLHLKTEIISFSPIHTFPLVTIGKKSYIIDPYDPFLIFDENQHLVDYKMLRSKEKKMVALRTKRNFGNPGELVSKKLYRELCNGYTKENKDIGPMISEYLNKNKVHLMVHIDSCSVEPFVMKRKAYPIASHTNEIVLYTPQCILNPMIKPTRIMRYYLGQDCKSNN